MPAERYYKKDREAAALLAEQLKDLPDNFLMCRDMMHAWDIETNFHVHERSRFGKPVTVIRRVLFCVRCATPEGDRVTKVQDYIQRKYGLEKITTYYRYQPGYALHDLPRGIKPSWIVQGEQYRRVMEAVADASKSDTDPEVGGLKLVTA